MANRRLALDLPEDLVDTIGSPEAAATKAKEALTLQLLRDGRIGESRVAELLGITRWDVLDLMSQYGIAHGPRNADELARDVHVAERAASP